MAVPVCTSSAQQMLILYNKTWSSQLCSDLPTSKSTCTQWHQWQAPRSCSLSLSPAGLRVGVWAVSPHVCFITSSSGVIYGARTGHSSERIISAEDKRKIMALLPGRSRSVDTAAAGAGEPQQARITRIWSAFPEAINCPSCVRSIIAPSRSVWKTKRYLPEHKFHYCLLLMLTDVWVFFSLKRKAAALFGPVRIRQCGVQCCSIHTHPQMHCFSLGSHLRSQPRSTCPRMLQRRPQILC